MFVRKDFYKKLNALLDECGNKMPQGSKRRAFLAYSWKKYHTKSKLNMMDISRYKDIHDQLKANKKYGLYLRLMYNFAQ